MKLYTVRKSGNVPQFILKHVGPFENMPINKDSFFLLDSAIEFIVCDCGEADGNTNKADMSAWLTTKGQKGDLWNVWIESK